MRVLVVNKFTHHVGGVETYLDWQAQNLGRLGIETHFFGMMPPSGEEVITSIRDRVTFSPNREFNATKLLAARAALSSIYSPAVERLLNTTIDQFQPDLVHFHSTCRQLTPSVARAITRRGLPGVLTAHEYKQVCATQRLWDESQNKVCTACLNGSTASRMRNVAARRCVRGSTLASIVAIPEIPIADHYWARSNVVIHAPSKFMGETLSRADYVPNRVHVLDLPWGAPEPRRPAHEWEHRAIFVGRLEKEKGVDVLLDAWELVQSDVVDSELIIAGGGSEQKSLEFKARSMGLRNVHFTGRYERAALGGLLNKAALSVHPSKWYENSPYAVRESLLHGVPAIVSDVGGMPEMIDRNSGTAVPPGDPLALGRAILSEFAKPRAGTERLRNSVAKRATTDENHLDGLQGIYDTALSTSQGAG